MFDNLVGIDGFEFVEFVYLELEKLDVFFCKMGYVLVVKYRFKNIIFYWQGDIIYVFNVEFGSYVMCFVGEYGFCVVVMVWCVVNVQKVYDYVIVNGVEFYIDSDKILDVLVIVGIGGLLLYFVEIYGDKGLVYFRDFEWFGDIDLKLIGVGFYYLDYLIYNVYCGNMDKWWVFYRDFFNFKQIYFFDIDGCIIGLVSWVIILFCGKIWIFLNEFKDDISQIEEYLRKYKGEGIQYIVVGMDNIYIGID